MKLLPQRTTETLPPTRSVLRLSDPEFVDRNLRRIAGSRTREGAGSDSPSIVGVGNDARSPVMRSAERNQPHPIEDQDLNLPTSGSPQWRQCHDFSRVPVHATGEFEQSRSGESEPQLLHPRTNGVMASTQQAASYGIQGIGGQIPHKHII